MVIESRTMVGAVGAFAIVGAAIWFSLSAMSSAPPTHAGTVEIRQVQERSWAVEIKDMDATAATAANR